MDFSADKHECPTQPVYKSFQGRPLQAMHTHTQ